MTISAKIIADSISPAGKRLTSFEIQCHRWILAEINTHRMLSRNYRSSRAVPVAKLIQEVHENPAMPVAWLKNKPGMVATEPMSQNETYWCKVDWQNAAKSAAHSAEMLLRQDLHKQWVNRILEPFLFVHGVISGTEWNNFFALRRAPDAQPEFKVLADAMHEALNDSIPRLLQPGEWHLPYVSGEDYDACWTAPDETLITDGAGIGKIIKLSVARVARVSIKPFDGENINIEKDLALYDRLLAQKHMSPFEHQATPDIWDDRYDPSRWSHPGEHGNLTGWRQYRKMIPNEHITG